MAMAPEIIRLVPEPQVRINIATLFAAHEILPRAKEERESKYEKERVDLIQLAATELKTTPDAARAVQKQKDLETLKNQFEADMAAFAFMADKIDKRLEDLGYSCPREMIEVLEEKLDRLQKIVDEADTKEKKLTDEIRALRERKRRLENRIKTGQVLQTTQLPEATPQPPQVQPAQARRRPRARR